VGSAHKQTGIPHFDNKWRIEETVRGLRFPSHVILRPVFFMENLLAPFSLQGSTLAWALGPGTKLQMIAVDDIGWFGARAFTHAAALNRREIDLAGDVRTMPEAAAILTEGLGRPIAFAQTPIEQVRQYSKETATMLQWFERVGYSADIAGLEREFGRALTKLPDWARRHARPDGGAETREPMVDLASRGVNSISTLLTRNLHDVFGENDPARRRAAIDEIFTEDCVFYEPKGVYRGRDAIDRVAGAIKATHPDFRYQPIAEPEELGNGGRIQWVSGRPGEAPAYAGTDFIIARDGQIATVYLFSTSSLEIWGSR
jgi:hypothetical protein